MEPSHNAGVLFLCIFAHRTNPNGVGTSHRGVRKTKSVMMVVGLS